MKPGRAATVASLGIAHTLARASSYYLPAIISTAMAAHLPRLLQSGGVPLATALVFAGLVGRLLEYGLLRRIHPLTSARLAGAMHTLGAVVFLGFGVPAAALQQRSRRPVPLFNPAISEKTAPAPSPDRAGNRQNRPADTA